MERGHGRGYGGRTEAMRLYLVLAIALAAANAEAGSDKPPAGAPWTMDFGAALEKAAEDGKPVFLYFTKTY